MPTGFGVKIDAVETVQHASFPNLIHVRVLTSDGLIGTGETFYGTEAVAAQMQAVADPCCRDKIPCAPRRTGWRCRATLLSD